MAQPFKNRSEGRKKWEKGLDNSGNIEGNSHCLLASSSRPPPPAAMPSPRLVRRTQRGTAWLSLVLDMRLRMG